MRSRVRGWFVETMDRLTSSDPGRSRIRMALSGVIAMGTALGIEYLFGLAMGLQGKAIIVPMLLGAVVAMMGSMALSGLKIGQAALTALFFPVAVGVGLTAGAFTEAHTVVNLVVFVVIMFIAVFIRRFGRAFFFYGFMMWIGYFISTLLKASPGALPGLIIAVAVASAWVLLLSATVLRVNSARTLRATIRAYDARARAMVRQISDLLGTPPDETKKFGRRRDKLTALQAGLAEAALMVEGWTEDPRSLPNGSASVLRRQLLDAQHVLDRAAGSAVALAGQDPTLTAKAIDVAEYIGIRNDAAAHDAAEELVDMAGRVEEIDGQGWLPARHFGVAALSFLKTAESAESAGRDDEDFEPTTNLMMGNLPGSGAVFKDVPARGRKWNPLARLDMVGRQAVQVTVAGILAIVFGRIVSDSRYYWAVIAAFVAFTGTATRAETFIKAFNRVLGTVAGLFVSIWLAHVTAGNTALVIAVILCSMFCGFYLIRISYAYMIFFITIMIGQMYTVLNQFSDELLLMRLAETAVGAAAGILVSLVVVPLSATDALRSARDALLSDLRDLLTGAAAYLDGTADEEDTAVERDAVQRTEDTRDTEPTESDDDEDEEDAGFVPTNLAGLDAKTRALDDRFRQMTLAAKPRAHPLIVSSRTLTLRRRVNLFHELTTRSRALVVGIRAGSVEHPEFAAKACRALAEAVSSLMSTRPGKPVPELHDSLQDADAAILKSLPSTPGPFLTDANVLRPLANMHDLLNDIVATARRS